MLTATFPSLEQMRVVDLGGRPETWLQLERRPKHVTILNLERTASFDDPSIEVLHGDACQPPSSLLERDFDLVFSNSLVEHVGGHFRRVQLAETIHRLASLHWVQTPYRYFPLEPHWLFPFLQFMPPALRAAIVHQWPLGHTRPSSRQSALRVSLETELVGITEMRFYFPDSRIVHERVGPLTKSIISVRDTA